MYRTDYLQQVGGWSLRTMAEDMDLTWTAYQLGNMVIPILAATISPVVLVPALMKAYSRGETWKALSSIPAFFTLRFVNSAIFLEALFKEVVLHKPPETYEKGH